MVEYATFAFSNIVVSCTLKIQSISTKKTYFASDFHLGVRALTSSVEREKKIVSWLEEIRHDAAEIYFVGDIFDYWFEYKQVIPKGFYRLIGKLSELRDQGIPIYFFTGNHDMWMFSYFEEELGIPIYREPIVRELNGKKFFIGHGDGLGPGDLGYKLIKKIFSNSVCQWLFARLHPNFGIWLMRFFSGHSRASSKEEKVFLGADKEWLLLFCEQKLKTEEFDYFIFGHRHLPIEYTLSNKKSQYINLGDWTDYCSYGVFDGKQMKLEFYKADRKVFPG